MATSHCSRNYHGFGILKLETFADGVKTGIYNNDPPFTAPPLTEVQLNTLIENYHHKYDEYKNGGKLKKPFFVLAKAALIKGLDDIAEFVDNLTGVTDEIIAMGGYTPTKTIDSEGQAPAQTAGAIIKRGGEGEMFAEVPKVDGAVYYGCIVTAGPLPAYITLNASGQLIAIKPSDVNPDPNPNPAPEPLPGTVIAVVDITKSRKKRFLGLHTGTVYYFYFYAANANGVSILSEVRSLICG